MTVGVNYTSGVNDMSDIGTELGKCDISDEQERKCIMYYGNVSTANDF